MRLRSRYQGKPTKDRSVVRKRHMLIAGAAAIGICISIWIYSVLLIIRTSQALEQQALEQQQIAHNHGHAHVVKKQSPQAVIRNAQEKMSRHVNGAQCSPRYDIMTGEHVYHLIELWFQANCPINFPRAQSCRFVKLGQYLMNHAIQHDLTMITLEIGALDGKSLSDPMYKMFYEQERFVLRKKDRFRDLDHWMPIVIEPVPELYQKLVQTYTDMEQTKGLSCAVPIPSIVSYNETDSNGKCQFCRFNLSPTAPEACRSKPDWLKELAGSSDCKHAERIVGATAFKSCVIQEALPCGTVKGLMTKHAPDLPEDATIVMMRIQVGQGYESELIEGMEKELHPRPLVVQFDNQGLKDEDREHPLSGGRQHHQITIATLESMGYRTYQEHEDRTLAIYLPDAVRQVFVGVDSNIKENNALAQDPFYHVLDGI